MYTRLCNPLKLRSFFIFGARGTGKTWLLRRLFRPEEVAVQIDLLDEVRYLDHLSDPKLLEKLVRSAIKKLNQEPQAKWIIIDEVQRLPKLLNSVHLLLEDPECHSKIFFALTGSSARKLKRGGANLLAGRALTYHLFPLTYAEAGEDWPLESFLHWGSLPAVVTAGSEQLQKEILMAYVGTYIKEEIKEEQIVRQIEPFARFLEAASQANTTVIQYSKIARAAMVNEKAVSRYFEILEDTLIGFFLEPFSRSTRERTVARAKFYFIDPGLVRALSRLLNSKIEPKSYAWGKAFEHFFILECYKRSNYARDDAKFSYLLTKDGAEIDLIVERGRNAPLCIEIKSGERVDEVVVRKLVSITESVPQGVPLVVYDGPDELEIEGVAVLPWRVALERYFA